jgi:hypothetical protein
MLLLGCADLVGGLPVIRRTLSCEAPLCLNKLNLNSISHLRSCTEYAATLILWKHQIYDSCIITLCTAHENNTTKVYGLSQCFGLVITDRTSSPMVTCSVSLLYIIAYIIDNVFLNFHSDSPFSCIFQDICSSPKSYISHSSFGSRAPRSTSNHDFSSTNLLH